MGLAAGQDLSHKQELAFVQEVYCRFLGQKDKTGLDLDVIDWQYVLKYSANDALITVLYLYLESQKIAAPAQVKERLKTAYLNNLRRNLFINSRLEEILKHLKQEKIEVLLLKGIYLANAVYEDIGLRPMTDIDLLIRPQDLKDIEKSVFDLGFHHDKDYGPGGYVKTDPSYPIALDLHSEIWYVDRLDEIWRNSRKINLAGSWARIMSVEDALIYQAAHTAVYHGSLRPLWLFDIAKIILRYQNSLDWQSIKRKIKGYNLEIPFYFLFKRLKKDFRLTQPEIELTYKKAKSLQYRIYERIFKKGRPPVNIGHILRFFLLKGFLPKIRFFVQYLFPSRDFLIRRYEIRGNNLAYLYCYRIAKEFKAGFSVLKELVCKKT